MSKQFKKPTRCVPPQPKLYPSDDEMPKWLTEDYLAWARPLSFGSDPFLVGALFPCLSAIVGPRAYMMYGATKERPSLSSILIGPSTTSNKSGSAKLALQSTIIPINRYVDRVHDGNVKAYIEEKSFFDALPKDERADAEKPVPPVKQYLLVPDDMTSAALDDALSGGKADSHGSIAHYDELAELLGKRGGQHNAGMAAKLTKLNGCERIASKRRGDGKGIKQDLVIEVPFMSILACTTSQWFVEGMRDSDVTGGWLARYIMVEQREGLAGPPPAFPPAEDPAPRARWHRRVVNVFKSQAIAGLWSMDIYATATYEKFHKELWTQHPSAPEQVAAVVGRQLANTRKLALLFEIFSCEGKPQRDGNTNVITQESAAQACALMRYFVAQMLTLVDTTLVGGDAGLQQKLLQELRDKGTMTRSDVYRFIGKHKRGARSKMVDDIVDTLVAQEFVTVFEQKKTPNARNTTTYVRLWKPGDEDPDNDKSAPRTRLEDMKPTGPEVVDRLVAKYPIATATQETHP